MLRRLGRWLLYSVVTFCILLVAAAGLLWWFFPAERVQNYDADALSVYLQRPVAWGLYGYVAWR